MIVVVRRHDDVSTVGVFWTRARVWTLNTPPPLRAGSPPGHQVPAGPQVPTCKEELARSERYRCRGVGWLESDSAAGSIWISDRGQLNLIFDRGRLGPTDIRYVRMEVDRWPARPGLGQLGIQDLGHVLTMVPHSAPPNPLTHVPL